MFISDAELAAALKDALQKQQSETLDAFWSGIVEAANLEAYNDLLRIFTERGYYKAVIDQWDAGPVYQRLIGLYRCQLQAAVNQPDQFSKDGLKLTDPREMLKTSSIMVNGVFQHPGATSVITDAGAGVSQVTTGPFDVSGDMFTGPDPQDVRRGTPTRF